MCIDLCVCGLCPAGHHSVTTFVFTGSAAPPRPPHGGHCWSWSPPWGWTRPGVWAGLVWPELVCAECQGYMRPLLLCCCNLVSWSPTDCSLRPEAAAESSQLLPPPAALQHSPHSCHELHSEAANPITHNLAVPSIGTKSETRQGKYNRLNYFYGCSCGGNYSERMPRCFGGSAVSAAGSAACPGRPGPPSLPPYTCQLLTSPLRGYSLLTVHAARAAEDDVTPLLLRQPIISYENNFPPRQHINNTNNLCIYCLL